MKFSHFSGAAVSRPRGVGDHHDGRRAHSRRGERPDRLPGRRPRREHVVDHDDVLDPRPHATPHEGAFRRERAGDVGPTFPGTETRLVASRPHAPQRRAQHRIDAHGTEVVDSPNRQETHRVDAATTHLDS